MQAGLYDTIMGHYSHRTSAAALTGGGGGTGGGAGGGASGVGTDVGVPSGGGARMFGRKQPPRPTFGISLHELREAISLRAERLESSIAPTETLLPRLEVFHEMLRVLPVLTTCIEKKTCIDNMY